MKGRRWPAAFGWPIRRTARPGAPNKYFIVSADCHANEPANLWAERIDRKDRDRLPRVVTDDQGGQWRVAEGYRPDRLRIMALDPGDQYHWGASNSFRIATKAARPPHRPVRVGVKPDVCSMARRHSMLGGHQFDQSPLNSLAG